MRKMEGLNKIKVSIVSYLNSKPFLWGLRSSAVSSMIDLSVDIPSKVAAKLTTGKADLGLIPVAALTDLDKYRLIGDYCIGAYGDVKTVVLASEVPLDQVKTILLDYQSRTSVMLVKVLARFFWKRDFIWENTCADFEKKLISGARAGVVIGDRVFSVEKKFPYLYDLSGEWEKFTGLPFVFAAWASTVPLTEEFCRLFNEALEAGIKGIPLQTESLGSDYPGVDIADYFSHKISFEFDSVKQRALDLFLSYVRELKP